MVQSRPSQIRQPTGKLIWKGLSLFIVLVAVLSAIWFFLTAQQLNDRLQGVGGSARGEHQQVNSRPDENG